jgi:hypothetical protein
MGGGIGGGRRSNETKVLGWLTIGRQRAGGSIGHGAKRERRLRAARNIFANEKRPAAECDSLATFCVMYVRRFKRICGAE